MPGHRYDQQQPVKQFWDWFYLIFAIPFFLYVIGICIEGHILAPLISLTPWYPFLGYVFTGVEFYDDYMIIRRPLFFFKKTIPYNEISKMYETKGKGTMVRVYLMDNAHFWSFSPPTLRKNQMELVSFVTSKGIEYDYND